MQPLREGESLAPGLHPHVIPDYSLPRDGPGERGAGVQLAGAEKEEADKLMKKWFMNVVARLPIPLVGL